MEHLVVETSACHELELPITSSMFVEPRYIPAQWHHAVLTVPDESCIALSLNLWYHRIDDVEAVINQSGICSPPPPLDPKRIKPLKALNPHGSAPRPIAALRTYQPRPHLLRVYRKFPSPHPSTPKFHTTFTTRMAVVVLLSFSFWQVCRRTCLNCLLPSEARIEN